MLNKEFRGKRKDNGQFVYGDLTRYSEEMSYITEDLLGDEPSIQVLTKTVGQYIGTEDKNGKKIYEYDIMKTKDGKIRVVKFLFPSYYLSPTLEEKINVDAFDMLDTSEEIIGNYHDNPELLENNQ